MSTGSALPERRASARNRAAARVTLRNVAQLAGVSATAASFVLNGRADQRISDATAAKVRAAAEELGYRPDLTARILRTGTSGTIAVISDFISTAGYAGGVVRGALQAAQEKGALLYLAETLGDVSVEHELLQGMLDRRVDGFIYASMFTREVTVPEPLRRAPAVLLNCTASGVRLPSVLPDEVGAGASAARALLDAGHSEAIWFVGGLEKGRHGTAAWNDTVPLALSDRLKGVRAELKRGGTSLAGVITVSDWEPPEGRRAVAEAIARGVKPRALVCVNDRVAMGAYQALEAAGLGVPDDVSVVSFDGSDLAAWLQPELTSVALPHEALGRVAVQTLLTGSTGVRKQLVPMPVRSGGSIAPPA